MLFSFCLSGVLLLFVVRQRRRRRLSDAMLRRLLLLSADTFFSLSLGYFFMFDDGVAVLLSIYTFVVAISQTDVGV